MEAAEDRELQIISDLKGTAIEIYQELKNENEKNKDEYDRVRLERDEAVRRLEEFSKISHMVIEEVGFMQNNLEIEKTCRESAEALACKLNKENKNLKRISALYMSKLGPDIITEEISLNEPDQEEDPCTSLSCQRRVTELQERIITVEEKKKTASIELEDLRYKLLELIAEVNATKKENVALRKEVFDQRKLLEKYNRVSVLAVEEYEGLESSLEMEKELRHKAESLAREMYIEQSQLKRQSILLLQTCAPDQQLLHALDHNAQLTQLLEEERAQHRLQVRDLEEQLAEEKQLKEIDSLRKALEMLEEEKKDVELRLEGSESTLKDLKHSVEELQKRVHQAENPPPPLPPPPPPLPPPPPPLNPIRSLMSIIRKKPSAAVKKECPALPESGNMGELKKQAVEEMIDRIKRGVHLRPVQQTVRVKTQAGSGIAASSAVQELRGILDTMSSTPGRKGPGAPGATSHETELERILRRRKVTTEQDAPAGALTALESKSMPVLGSAAHPPLRHQPRHGERMAATETQRPDANQPLNIKAESHSAGALLCAGDGPGKSLGSDDKKGKDMDSSSC